MRATADYSTVHSPVESRPATAVAVAVPSDVEEPPYDLEVVSTEPVVSGSGSDRRLKKLWTVGTLILALGAIAAVVGMTSFHKGSSSQDPAASPTLDSPQGKGLPHSGEHIAMDAMMENETVFEEYQEHVVRGEFLSGNPPALNGGIEGGNSPGVADSAVAGGGPSLPDCTISTFQNIDICEGMTPQLLQQLLDNAATIPQAPPVQSQPPGLPPASQPQATPAPAPVPTPVVSRPGGSAPNPAPPPSGGSPPLPPPNSPSTISDGVTFLTLICNCLKGSNGADDDCTCLAQ